MTRPGCSTSGGGPSRPRSAYKSNGSFQSAVHASAGVPSDARWSRMHSRAFWQNRQRPHSVVASFGPTRARSGSTAFCFRDSRAAEWIGQLTDSVGTPYRLRTDYKSVLLTRGAAPSRNGRELRRGIRPSESEGRDQTPRRSVSRSAPLARRGGIAPPVLQASDGWGIPNARANAPPISIPEATTQSASTLGRRRRRNLSETRPRENTESRVSGTVAPASAPAPNPRRNAHSARAATAGTSGFALVQRATRTDSEARPHAACWALHLCRRPSSPQRKPTAKPIPANRTRTKRTDSGIVGSFRLSKIASRCSVAGVCPGFCRISAQPQTCRANDSRRAGQAIEVSFGPERGGLSP